MSATKLLWSGYAARVRAWRLRRRARKKAHRAPAQWLRRPADPADGEHLCIFVMLARDGQLLPHSIDHARAWADAGFVVVAVVIVDALDQHVGLDALDFASGILIRVNAGYDFGAWAAAIVRLRRRLRRYATVAVANDSVLGPSASFDEMLARVRHSDADMIGLVESEEIKRHFQSFVLFFRPGALRARAFARFWSNVRTGDRRHVIDHYETELLAHFKSVGLRTEALFPVDAGGGNPTLTQWRTLIHAGFPYLKVQLFRDNPFGVPLADWAEETGRAGFDTAQLARQMTALGLPLHRPGEQGS